MNTFLLIANILTFLAFIIHTFVGDKEIRLIEPEKGIKKQAIWTMSRCGWHWISIDLLLASIIIAMINFSNFFLHEQSILQLLTIYFAAYGFIWLFTIMISKSFPKNYLNLGQWMLLLGISALLYAGS